MDVILLTYSVVAHDRPHLESRLYGVDDGIRDFLTEHVEHMQKAQKSANASPPGIVADIESREIFQALHAGSADDFLAGASTLTKRLIGKMNKATKSGILMILRAESGAGRLAAVLKLEIQEPTGAVLKRLHNGEIELSAVKDMLEKPGDLQKGVLVVDGLPDDEVICRDKLFQQSKYFPEAMGIQMFLKPKESSAAFLELLQQAGPKVLESAVSVLPEIEPGPPREVLARLGEVVSGMESHLQNEIATQLEDAPRPVRRVDTSRPITRTIQAGEITIKGTARSMQEMLKITAKPDGGWQIVIDAPARPYDTYQ
ncbi:hypothetical protein [Nonomuraea sp. NPDC050540]|uniref:hypothetical protein n=1 Tax=Nonomuraea sp. NPDC050540 TaxID=3364367 RepID=UPI003792ED01